MQTYYTPPTIETLPAIEASTETGNSLGAVAAEFSKNIDDASSKLVAAAGQFATISGGFNNAVAEVKAAAARADEARRAAEAVQEKIGRDYSSLSSLMQELQERIGALATLAKPFAANGEPAQYSPMQEKLEAAAPEADTGPATPPESADIRTRWQGWRG